MLQQCNIGFRCIIIIKESYINVLFIVRMLHIHYTLCYEEYSVDVTNIP